MYKKIYKMTLYKKIYKMTLYKKIYTNNIISNNTISSNTLGIQMDDAIDKCVISSNTLVI
jgi:parallel beta-helix repeat protein